MTESNSRHLEKLKKIANDKNLILWVGAGYSKNLGFPTWKELIEKLAKEYFHENELEFESFSERLNRSDANYLNLLGEFEIKRREELLEILLDEFKLPYDEVNHSAYNKFRALWKLSNKIITTNYDRALDITIQDTNCQIVHWFEKKSFNALRGNNQKFLFKIHGSADRVNYSRCVLFKEQYEEVYLSDLEESYEKVSTHFLKHILTDSTILFIGYGGFDNDTYLTTIFEYTHRLLRDIGTNKHYFFKERSSKIEYNFLEGIDINNYAEIDDFLEELLKARKSTKLQSHSIDSYRPEYVGRALEKKQLKEFLNSEAQNSLFIWGRGGMGKTHLLKHILDEQNQSYLYFKLTTATTLPLLSNYLGLGIVFDGSELDFNQEFIDKVAAINQIIIFDDFYEIDTEQNPSPILKNTLLELLKRRRKNKTILISRVLETSVGYINNLKVDLLVDENEHSEFIDSLLKYSFNDIEFENKQKLKTDIWKTSQGYPIVSEILLNILSEPGRYKDFRLSDIGSFDYEKFDTENNDGKEYVGRLLGVLLEGKDKEARELILNLSIAIKEVPISLIDEIPGGSSLVRTRKRKDFIRENTSPEFETTYSLHPLVWELLKKEAGKRPRIHLIYANYYYKELLSDLHNYEAYKLADYHYSLCDQEEYDLFIEKIKSLVYKVYFIENDSKAKITLYKIRIDQGDTSPINYTILATELRKIGEIQEAIIILEDALKKHNSNKYILNILGKLNSEIGDKFKAIEYLEKSNDVSYSPQTANELGIAYRQIQNLTKSIEVLKNAHENSPRNPYILNELSISLNKNSEQEQAIKYLLKAFELDSNNTYTLNALGKLYREVHEIEKSKDFFQKSITTDYSQNNLHAFNGLATTYKENNQENEAIDMWSESLELDASRNNVHAYEQLGRYYIDLKRYHEAIDVLKRSIAVDDSKSNIHSYNALATAYRKDKKDRLAKDILRSGLLVDPANPAIANQLAGMKLREGLYQDALEMVRDSLSYKQNFKNKYLKDLEKLILERIEDQNFDIDKLRAYSYPALVNFLNVFIYDTPDKEIANKIYKELSNRSNFRSNPFKERRKFIRNMEDIINPSESSEFNFKTYLSASLRSNKRTHIAVLLEKLVEIFPNNINYIGSLGRTLNHFSVQRSGEAQEYLSIALDYYNNIGNTERYVDYVLYYLYGLIHQEKFDEVENFIKKHPIIQESKYKSRLDMLRTFMAKAQGEGIEEICERYEEAINLQTEKDRKIKYINLYLEYLSNNDLREIEKKYNLLLDKVINEM